jgi:hypothetical protein
VQDLFIPSAVSLLVPLTLLTIFRCDDVLYKELLLVIVCSRVLTLVLYIVTHFMILSGWILKVVHLVWMLVLFTL